MGRQRQTRWELGSGSAPSSTVVCWRDTKSRLLREQLAGWQALGRLHLKGQASSVCLNAWHSPRELPSEFVAQRICLALRCGYPQYVADLLGPPVASPIPGAKAFCNWDC